MVRAATKGHRSSSRGKRYVFQDHDSPRPRSDKHPNQTQPSRNRSPCPVKPQPPTRHERNSHHKLTAFNPATTDTPIQAGPCFGGLYRITIQQYPGEAVAPNETTESTMATGFSIANSNECCQPAHRARLLAKLSIRFTAHRKRCRKYLLSLRRPISPLPTLSSDPF